jgi:hypothetical protein
VSEELLPTISLPAQLLVKTEVVPLDKSEADVFAKLIPIEIHLLASEFSDAKDQLLRLIDANVASKTVDLDKVSKLPELFAAYSRATHVARVLICQFLAAIVRRH